jgi:uncharacterized protein (TIRG00374 family)
MNKKYNWITGIILGIIFLIAWLRIVNWQEFLSYFAVLDVFKLLPFSLFYVLAYVFRSCRWRVILKPIHKMRYSESFYLFMSGMLVNYIVPVRAGELLKSVLLKRRSNVRISASLPSVFIDKLTDLFPIVLILLLTPLLSIKLNLTLKLVVLILFLFFLFFLGFLFFAINHREKAVSILNFFLRIIPGRFRENLKIFFSNFVDGLSIMQGRYLDYIKVIILTALAVISEAFYIYQVFTAFGSSSSFIYILFGYTLMNLTYILPTPPAQIGSNQFMWVLIFAFALGINKDLTSAAVTFSHLLTSIWIFALGAISLLALNIGFKELVPQNEIKDKT